MWPSPNKFQEIFFWVVSPHSSYFARLCRTIIALLSIIEIPIYWFIAVLSIEPINRALERGLSYGSSAEKWPIGGKPGKKILPKFQEGEFWVRLKGVTKAECLAQIRLKLVHFGGSYRPKRCPIRGETRGNREKPGWNQSDDHHISQGMIGLPNGQIASWSIDSYTRCHLRFWNLQKNPYLGPISPIFQVHTSGR